MSTSASRQLRSARNALSEALGLGETYPLRDLPVSAEPAVATFGALARVAIEDSERSVAYRLLDQDAQPLPGGAAPAATGSGATLGIDTPAIAEDITFTVRAERPSGRAAVLVGTAQVKVGLDASLALAIVPPGATPIVVDHGATVEVEIARSQEGVTYRLVARPSPDPAAPDDATAMASDIALSARGGTAGTGEAIRLTSVALIEDTVIRVRAAKVFGGRNPRPTQATLLAGALPVYVRPDAGLAVTATPAIVDHAGTAAIRIAAAAAGVSYALHARAIADAEFSRADPPDPATLAVPTPGGPVRVAIPPATVAWDAPPGFAALGDPAPGGGASLALPVPARPRDTMIVVEARKRHGAGAGSFTSAARLAQPAAVLVRPDPRPPLRLAASISDGKLTQLAALAGEPGVFYAMTAAAPLGELYLHQPDPADPEFNKGIGALALEVDWVVTGGTPTGPTSAAPPPVPRLDLAPLALPADLAVTARRAMTGLTADLGKVRIAPLPAAEVQPAAVAAGGGARVAIAQPVAGERYAVTVNGHRVADPVAGAGVPLSLDTGPLAPGSRVRLWAQAGEAGAAIEIERSTPVALTIG